jgi:hypothetical protein
MSTTVIASIKIRDTNRASSQYIGNTDMYNDDIVTNIFDDSKKCNSLSSYAFVDIINGIKPKFLSSIDNMPTQTYIRFIMYLLTNLEMYSVEQLKIIERFCLRMDEVVVTGIIKYNNTYDEYITCNDLSYLLKKYRIGNDLILEIIKRDYATISNSLVTILAKNIRIKKQMCKYNGKCYRKNKEHLKTYFHD